MEITLQLFGAFRTLGSEASLSVADDATTHELTQSVEVFLRDNAREDLMETLAVSRFATDTAVLPKGAPLGAERRFAILPPVSGG